MSMTRRPAVSVTPEISDGLWTLFAHWHGREVGYLYAVYIDRRLCLQDFKIEERLRLSWPPCLAFLALLGVQRRTRSFRGQGVGSLLMETLIALAGPRGVREVWGSVTQHDIDETPFLLSWYERLGFAVRAPDGECIGNAVKKITMVLVPQLQDSGAAGS